MVSAMRWPTTILSVSSDTATLFTLPMARMKPCGGLMMALNESIPIPPRFETVNEPPWNSSGFIRLLRARLARSFTCSLISRSDLFCAARITGVSNPSSIATAIPRSTSAYWTNASPSNEALTRGTLTAACTAAFKTKSLIVIFAVSAPSPADFSSSCAAMSGAALIFFFFLSRHRLLRFRLRFLFLFLFGFWFFRFLFFFGRFFLLWSFLALSADEPDLVADLHLPAFFNINFGECAVLWRFPFHRRLVGFDLGNHFAGRNFVALFLLPRDEGALRHRVAQLRHLNLRHCSSGVANFFYSGHQLVGIWQNEFLKPLVVRHRHILLRNAHDRRVELIKNVFLNSVTNFRTDATERAILFDNHNVMRFRDGVEDHFLIQRFDRTKIDDLGRNIFLFELSGDSEREGHSLRVTDDRYIAAFAFHFRLPQRNEQFFVWRFNHSFRAVEKLSF